MTHEPRQRDKDRIESWKEIAVFFDRDERTVKRWEKLRGLPVYRMPGEKGRVFALATELIQWRDSGRRRFDSGEITAHVPDAPREAAEPLAVPQPTAATAPVPAPDTAPDPLVAKPFAQISPRPSLSGSRAYVAAAAALIALTAVIAGARASIHRQSSSGAQVAASPAPASIRPSAHTSPAAEYYLQGRYYWSHRTEASLRKSLDSFQRATVADPGYAPAWAGLADAYDLMPQYALVAQSEAFPLGLRAARRAVELDPSLSEAHRALAFGLFYWEWDLAGAFAEYRRAIEFNPRDEEAHSWYATSLLLTGRTAEALTEIEKARAISPSSRSILANQALIRYWNGDRESSIAQLRELERTEPDFLAPSQYLEQIYLHEGEDAGYVRELERTAALGADPSQTEIARAARRGLARGGRTGMLEAIRVAAERGPVRDGSSEFQLSYVNALLGHREQSDRHLHNALERHDFLVLRVLYDRDLKASMSGDRDFESVCQQVRLRTTSAHDAPTT